jgi:hypothetical protein
VSYFEALKRLTNFASLWEQKEVRNDCSNESLMERNSSKMLVSKYSILHYTESYKHKHVKQILERDLTL